METKGHLVSNPGLRAHSVGPNNILSRYVVAYHPKGGIGWIWTNSFDTIKEAYAYLDDHLLTVSVQIIDSKTDEILYKEDPEYFD